MKFHKIDETDVSGQEGIVANPRICINYLSYTM